MSDTTMTPERLIALLRQSNGTITHVDSGPLTSKFIAQLPDGERTISPLMFMALEKGLDLVSETTEKGITTRVYRIPPQGE
jgi:hypothetical protein